MVAVAFPVCTQNYIAGQLGLK